MPKLIDKDENELLNLQMSTDEHWTGKYWIDGKKIYKKIITWTGLRVGVSTINHSISNLNEFIDYEVTFTNECGYPDHGFAQWYDGDFHIPAVVTAWREHIEPYQS